jgi:4-amino-4-deoxy-L-arabinose transferase-like glycosyltransferase
MDSTLILTLLLAAWAFTKATQSARFRYLLLGAVLVGIAFKPRAPQAGAPFQGRGGMQVSLYEGGK